MTYRKMSDMPQEMQEDVREALRAEFRNPRRKKNPEIAKMLNQRFPGLGVASGFVRDYFRIFQYQSKDKDGVQLSTAEVEHQAKEMAEEMLGERAAEFLAQHSPLAPVPEALKATRLEEMGYDSPIEAIMPFHDLHYGSQIDPRVNGGFAWYNIDVARERITRWRNLLLRFAQREQLTTELTNGHILALGDDLEGHGDMFGTQKLTMGESIGFQYLGFVDDVSAVLLDLLAKYKHLTIYKVHGNHGRISKSSKDSYAPDNIELMAWQNIADRIRASCGGEWEPTTPGGVRILRGGMIDFYIASSPRMLVEIMGFKFIIMHGHGMKGIQSTYTGAMASKLAWNSVIGETINFMVKAHLHEAQQAEHEIGGAIVQGGCFVGPSDFSIGMSRPAASLPSQELFFMHPQHGKVHHETLHLASISEQRQYVEWMGR